LSRRPSRNIDFNKEEFLKVLSESDSHSEALIKLGYANVGGRERYKYFLSKLNPDLSHFSTRSRAVTKNNSYNKLESSYYRCKRSSVKRNIEFNISLDEFIGIINNTICFYCGKKGNTKLGDSRYNNTLTCGLDRVDNNLGYISGNVVACCKKCNFGKRTMSKKEFIDHFSDMVDYQRSLQSAAGLTNKALPVILDESTQLVGT